MCLAACLQGFPIRLAPGAPHAVRLLKGHPFSRQPGACDGDDADKGQVQQVMLTQLAPEQQLAPAEVLSGEQLPTFKVSRPHASTQSTRTDNKLHSDDSAVIAFCCNGGVCTQSVLHAVAGTSA